MQDVHLVSSTEWDGKLYTMSRETYLKHSDNALLKGVGIYVIYADHYDKKTFGRGIYIGQGDDVGERLKRHAATKRFWNRVLFFTSDWMNVAYTHNVEHAFIKAAKSASRYELDNDVSGQEKKLGLDDGERLQTYLMRTRAVLHLANIDIFTINVDEIYRWKRGRFLATLRLHSFTESKVVVLAGSQVLCMHGVDVELEEEISAGSVTKDGSVLTFAHDTVVRIDDGRISQSLLGISTSTWINSCGASVYDALVAFRSGTIFLPPS